MKIEIERTNNAEKNGYVISNEVMTDAVERFMKSDTKHVFLNSETYRPQNRLDCICATVDAIRIDKGQHITAYITPTTNYAGEVFNTLMENKAKMKFIFDGWYEKPKNTEQISNLILLSIHTFADI